MDECLANAKFILCDFFCCGFVICYAIISRKTMMIDEKREWTRDTKTEMLKLNYIQLPFTWNTTRTPRAFVRKNLIHYTMQQLHCDQKNAHHHHRHRRCRRKMFWKLVELLLPFSIFFSFVCGSVVFFLCCRAWMMTDPEHKLSLTMKWKSY